MALPVVKDGDKGENVATLQQRLTEMGYVVGSVDGDFGLRTGAAVRYFQSVNMLTADGIVGEQTWDHLELGDYDPTPDDPAGPLGFTVEYIGGDFGEDQALVLTLRNYRDGPRRIASLFLWPDVDGQDLLRHEEIEVGGAGIFELVHPVPDEVRARGGGYAVQMWFDVDEAGNASGQNMNIHVEV